MRIEVDARGQLCPKPVIMTKKQLDDIPNGVVTTIVDNDVARDNVSKLAVSLGYSLIIDRGQDGEYYIHITKGGIGEKPYSTNISPNPKTIAKKLTITIGSDKMGTGEEELGKILMRSFIYTVKETKPWPSTIIFLNSGIYLTCEGSQVLDDLKAMADKGVEIISCGTCLDYYDMVNKLQIGEIGNMYDIYEKMKGSGSTINI